MFVTAVWWPKKNNFYETLSNLEPNNIQATISAFWLVKSQLNPNQCKKVKLSAKNVKLSAKKWNWVQKSEIECKTVKLKMIDSSYMYFEIGQTKWRAEIKQRWDQNDPVERSVHVFCLPPPQALRFSRKRRWSRQARSTRNWDNHASAACRGRTKHGSVHDVPDQVSLILPI